MSAQARPRSSQASFQKACMNLTDSIVPVELITTFLPLGSVSAPAEAPQERVREGRRVAEGVAEGLADGLAVGLQLLAGLAPRVLRLRELGEADLRVPRPAVGDRVATRCMGNGQPSTTHVAGSVEGVVEAALALADGVGHVGDIDEAVGVEMRPVPKHLEDVRAGAQV